MRILILFIGMFSFLVTIAQVQKPNFDNLIKYVKTNKQTIYNTQFGIVPLAKDYAGKSPTHQISSIENLLSEYLNAENTGNVNQKDIIFYKIYNYLFNGKGLPYISLNAIGIDDNKYPIPFSGEYKYLRDIGLFVTMNKYNDGYSINVFDPIFGPLYFQKNSSGFKFYENQLYALEIFFPNGGEIYEYRPPTNYYEKRKKYYIKNLEGSWSIVGPNIGIDYDGSVRISEARYLPQYGHDDIRPINIKDNRYYIASDDLRESYVGNFKYTPSQYQKTLMAQAGQITVSQAADPNFYILNEKEGTRYSGVQNVTILSRSGFPIIPNYNEIVQVNDNFFITKLNNKYGLIYLTPETIKSNKFVLLENVYEILSVFPSSPNAPFFKVGRNIGELTTDYSYNENGILYKKKSNQDSSNIFIGSPISIIGDPVRFKRTNKFQYNFEIAQYDFPNKMSWKEAKNACKALGDYWRLPNVSELLAMGFKNYLPKTTYWSSEQRSGYIDGATIRIDSGLANIINVGKLISSAGVSSEYSVRAVRSLDTNSLIASDKILDENFENSKILNPIFGNLEIALNDFPNLMNREEAIIACNKLGNGWRLPNKDELDVLFQNKHNIGGFKDFDYLSISVRIYSDGKLSDNSYISQNFRSGDSGIYFKDSKGFIRAVRTF